MDTPRKTNLYRQIAKDYTPKQADMMICKYIEGLEQRIEALEAKLSESEQSKEAKSEETKTTKSRKKNASAASLSTPEPEPESESDETPEQPLPAESEMPAEEPTSDN